MTNNSPYSNTLATIGPIQTNPTNLNTNNNKEDDLPRLGRKKSSVRKSVSFNNTIDVTKIENWKKYNKDVSEETEYFQLMKKVKAFKERQALKAQKQNECCCIIF